eukprot:2979909-Prymnesium_polylepis.1
MQPLEPVHGALSPPMLRTHIGRVAVGSVTQPSVPTLLPPDTTHTPLLRNTIGATGGGDGVGGGGCEGGDAGGGASGEGGGGGAGGGGAGGGGEDGGSGHGWP